MDNEKLRKIVIICMMLSSVLLIISTAMKYFSTKEQNENIQNIQQAQEVLKQMPSK